MAGPSIGKGSLTLTTQDHITPGLAGIGDTLKSWANKTSAGLKSMLSMDTTKSWAAGLKGGVAGLAAGFGAGAFGGALSSIKELSSVGREAKSLGVASDQFMGLQQAAKRAGVEADGFGHVLAKMGKHVSDAQHGGAEATATFKQLGIPLADLAGKPLDQQFLRISDAINKLPPGSEQAAAAMSIFGKNGQSLLPMLQKGSSGLQEFINKQKALGVAIDQNGMNKLMAAQQAIPKMQNVLEGFKNKALVAIAPVITLIAGKLTKAMEYLQPLFDKVARALSTHWGVIADVLGEVFSLIGSVINEVSDWVSELFNLGECSTTVEDVVLGVWKAIGIAAAYVWDTLKAGAGVVAWVFGEMITQLTVVRKAMIDLLKLAGELPDELGGKFFRDAAKGQELLDAAMNIAGNKAKQWGTGAVDNFGKSADDVRKWFENRKNRKDDLEPAAQEFGEMVGKAAKKSVHDMHDSIIQGSKEDYSMIRQRELDQSNKETEAIVKEMKDAKHVNIEVRNIAQRIYEEVKSGKPLAAVPK